MSGSDGVPPASPAEDVRQQIAKNRVWIAVLVLFAGGWVIWDSAQNSGAPGGFGQGSVVDTTLAPTVSLDVRTTVVNTDLNAETALRWTLNGTGFAVGPESAVVTESNGAVVWTLPYDSDSRQGAGMSGEGEPIDVVAELSDAATGVVLARVSLTGASEAPAVVNCTAVAGLDARCSASAVGVDDTAVAVTVSGSVYIPDVTGLP